MNIAILGASSQIAKDLIVSLFNKTDCHCMLFARNTTNYSNGIRLLAEKKRYQLLEYSEFSLDYHFDVIINFVGVGDPAQAKKMGAQIFDVTEKYDQLALSYIKKNPACRYIFLSSGAVYGGNFARPVSSESVAQININNLKETDWYTIAKLYAEARHRALDAFNIIDVRVFNYFSHTQDINARFLITDIVRAIRRNEVFKTSVANIVRDFITPDDFFCLIKAIIDYQGDLNLSLDCYTKAPIDKNTLLRTLGEHFEFRYEYETAFVGINATGVKINYYSNNKVANSIGYDPGRSSIEGLLYEIKKI